MPVINKIMFLHLKHFKEFSSRNKNFYQNRFLKIRMVNYEVFWHFELDIIMQNVLQL